MPDTMTRADALRAFNTGAASAGDAQADPDLSLGGHRSSNEINTYGITIEDAIANITVQFASGGNAPGAGILECTGVDTLRWKDNGGTFGDPVTIGNGEGKIIESSVPGAYVRVLRSGGVDLVPGESTITLAYVVGNAVSQDTVSSAEAVAGLDEYRAIMLRNVGGLTVSNLKLWVATQGTARVSGTDQLGGSGAGTITVAAGNFDDWPAKGWCRIEESDGTLREIVYYLSRTSTSLTVPADGRGLLGTSAGAGANTDNIYPVPGIRIAIDTEGVVAGTEAVQTIVSSTTAPASVTWNSSILEEEGLDVGDVPAGEQVAIWIHRDVPAGAGSSASVLSSINLSFDAA